jgi:alcohol dehydrogenase (cytochrome c)
MMRLLPLVLLCSAAAAQVTYQRIRNAAAEPHNWLTYNGTYASTHYSTLADITPANAAKLQLEWVWQSRSLEKLEPTPLVVDGVMYLTEPPSTVVALDARTGRVFWTYQHPLPAVTYPCCGRINRGVAILDRTLFLGTLDSKLVALDAVTGRKKWEITVADYTEGYAIAMAPLTLKDRVIVGPAGGELGIKGFIAAYDANTGKQVWRFNTVPQPGEPGNETWGKNSWKYGGAPVWLTGSYDPELNLTYWGVGNPGPDWNANLRPGDNLYSSSVIALDADTGKLKWHFQFTPHDEWDWDAVQVPVLIDREWRGKMRKLMLWGNRNGFFYVLDRVTGEFLLGTPFVKQTWAKGLDERGRPIRIADAVPSAAGTEIWPGVQGGTNWYAPSYSPKTGLFYLTAWDDYHGTYFQWHQEYERGKWYAGGAVRAAVEPTRRVDFFKRPHDAGYAAVRAIDPTTGRKVWDFPFTDMSESGLLTTASNLLFSGSREGHFVVLDATDGKLLWRRYLGGATVASPITYKVDGRQYVAVASGAALFTFALPE